MIRIEIPAGNTRLASAIGRALVEYASETVADNNARTFGGLGGKPMDADIRTVTEVLGEAVDEVRPETQAGALGNEPTPAAEIATGQGSSTGMSAGATAHSDTREDTNGVRFNAEFCGEAKEPFYASGKNKGQWKKRKGVDEAVYDKWYADSLPAKTEAEPEAADENFDTSSAFGTTKPENKNVTMPTTCGELMVWISGQQAANRLNQMDVDDAFAKLNLSVADLFPPASTEQVAGHVANMFAVLGGLE